MYNITGRKDWFQPFV